MAILYTVISSPSSAAQDRSILIFTAILPSLLNMSNSTISTAAVFPVFLFTNVINHQDCTAKGALADVFYKWCHFSPFFGQMRRWKNNIDKQFFFHATRFWIDSTSIKYSYLHYIPMSYIKNNPNRRSQKIKIFTYLLQRTFLIHTFKP